MIDIRVALDKLAGFTTDEIVGEMRYLQIRGETGCPESCVIAAYITRITDIPPRLLGVSSSDVAVYSEINGFFERCDFVELTDNIQTFIANFDNRDYPDLIVEDE